MGLERGPFSGLSGRIDSRLRRRNLRGLTSRAVLDLKTYAGAVEGFPIMKFAAVECVQRMQPRRDDVSGGQPIPDRRTDAR